mgnify:CR=1 FL=1
MLSAGSEYKQELRLQIRAEFADKYHGANVKVRAPPRERERSHAHELPLQRPPFGAVHEEAKLLRDGNVHV